MSNQQPPLNNYDHMQGAIQLLRARMQYFAETIYTVPMLSKHTPCRCETQPGILHSFYMSVHARMQYFAKTIYNACAIEYRYTSIWMHNLQITEVSACTNSC